MVTPGLGPGYAVGKKGKKTQSNWKNMGERSEPSGSLAEFFFSSIPRRFSPPFSPDSSLVVPRGAWSQARSRPARGQSHHTGQEPMHRLNSLYKYVT